MQADTPNLPKLILGDVNIDDRGEVTYVNEFQFTGVKRFYVVSNHKTGLVRAWHAHRREAKYVMVINGAALVGAVAINDWNHPSKDTKVHRYVLSAHKPSVLYIPAGYANGFMSLTKNCKLMFFSTSTLDESTKDDVRFDSRFWDIWSVVER
jgi:dTDP-4-dehydrorhamnose 3,5-epimerase